MLELVPVPILVNKTNQLKRKYQAQGKKTRSAVAEGTSIFGTILWFIMLFLWFYIFYRNVMFIVKCKKKYHLLHFILAYFFNFIYFIYRLFAGKKCKY